MRAALIVNPVKADDVDQLRALVEKRSAHLSWDEPLWLETTPEDPGTGMAQRAVAERVDVVLCCGGDGTVNAVVTGLAGRGVPLGLLPCGTGNLLARNLHLPLSLEDAVDLALTGAERTLDLGRVGERRFVVMAGIGLDAAMMRDVDERLKTRVGWLAYLAPLVRHLRDRPARVGLRLDDGPRLIRRARAVIVGNVGRLQGGLALLPDAVPADGLLDVVVGSPRTAADWLRLVARLVTRASRGDAPVEWFRAARVEIRAAEPITAQLDGEILGAVTSLVVEVDPAALAVKVPR